MNADPKTIWAARQKKGHDNYKNLAKELKR